jgi:hypothetical protein
VDELSAAPGAMGSDDLAALLKEWGDEAEEDLSRAVGEEYDWLSRLLTLVAAIEQVLKLPGEWDRETVRCEAVAARSAPRGQRASMASARAIAYKDCADALLEAIASALAGKEGSDGR